MATLKDLVNSASPGGVPEETDPPTMDDNRMPKAAVDPWGLLYRPEPQTEFLYTVPDSNFSGEALSDDPQLNPLKAGVLALTENPEDAPEPPSLEERYQVEIDAVNDAKDRAEQSGSANTATSYTRNSKDQGDSDVNDPTYTDPVGPNESSTVPDEQSDNSIREPEENSDFFPTNEPDNPETSDSTTTAPNDRDDNQEPTN